MRSGLRRKKGAKGSDKVGPRAVLLVVSFMGSGEADSAPNIADATRTTSPCVSQTLS
jgi:hypothetical protein